MQMFKILSGIAASLCLALVFTQAQAEQKNDKMMKGNIVQTVEAEGNFTILVKALRATGLDKELQAKGPYTLFAPTDEAFKKLGQDKLDDLMKPENKAKLANILKYHVVTGKVMTDQLEGKKTEVTTIDQRMLDVDGTDGIMVENAKVIEPNMKATNGVVQGVDTVFIP